ncbi:hypothetical protein VHEMI08004 [[Torrubiella] hemipterigena]|uniref:Uncharacterized protein n=1 Tax=[Torrubiella] hemipterigena TaxID=1531966 RepID=A0A0A1TNX5_9HYPO|nr:hypothetical protein VHEMI08004 [[Torrubiella] hemipterigena]
MDADGGDGEFWDDMFGPSELAAMDNERAWDVSPTEEEDLARVLMSEDELIAQLNAALDDEPMEETSAAVSETATEVAAPVVTAEQEQRFAAAASPEKAKRSNPVPLLLPGTPQTVPQTFANGGSAQFTGQTSTASTPTTAITSINNLNRGPPVTVFQGIQPQAAQYQNTVSHDGITTAKNYGVRPGVLSNMAGQTMYTQAVDTRGIRAPMMNQQAMPMQSMSQFSSGIPMNGMSVNGQAMNGQVMNNGQALPYFHPQPAVNPTQFSQPFTGNSINQPAWPGQTSFATSLPQTMAPPPTQQQTMPQQAMSQQSPPQQASNESAAALASAQMPPPPVPSRTGWMSKQQQQLQRLQGPSGQANGRYKAIQPAVKIKDVLEKHDTTAYDDLVMIVHYAYLKGVTWGQQVDNTKLCNEIKNKGTILSSTLEALREHSLERLTNDMSIYLHNGTQPLHKAEAHKAAREVVSAFCTKHTQIHAALKTVRGLVSKPTELPEVIQRVSDIPKKYIYQFKPPQTGSTISQPAPAPTEVPRAPDAEKTFRLTQAYIKVIDGQETVFHMCSDGDVRILNDEQYHEAKARTEDYNRVLAQFKGTGTPGMGLGGPRTTPIPATQTEGAIRIPAEKPQRKRKASVAPSTPKRRRSRRDSAKEAVPSVSDGSATSASVAESPNAQKVAAQGTPSSSVASTSASASTGQSSNGLASAPDTAWIQPDFAG